MTPLTSRKARNYHAFAAITGLFYHFFTDFKIAKSLINTEVYRTHCRVKFDVFEKIVDVKI